MIKGCLLAICCWCFVDRVRGQLTGECVDNTECLNIHPNFREPITNVTASVGREAILSCIVQELGAYKVAWLRVDTQTILTIANHVITKNHRIGVTHSDHRTWFLHIREVKETDRGWYMCQINTDPMKSQNGYLDVVVPPDIIDDETSADMIIREGSNVTLKCSATGSPRPNITWRKENSDGILIGVDQKVTSVEGQNFNISKVNRLHMGSYLCIASNGVPPTVSKRIALIVHFPPMITVQDQLVSARIGQSKVLTCTSEAFPKSINYWTKDKTEIIAQDGRYEPVFLEDGYVVHMNLTIRSVTKSDFGAYKCVSRNSLGDTDGTISLYENDNTAYETSDNPKNKGKLKKNSNNLLEGNQNGLKEQDLKLRGRKDNSNDEEDYEDSGTSAAKCSASLAIVAVALVLCFHHHLQLQALHPA
ncbi:opioid-binding protein/cell adhesion molecule homolog isoform X1 [Diachasmimorpha longicaudata]|uniref:opioid-binding protein/cell adhesion molecule homolog isoform X1 n=1 Tax=Diachasmimorpha longicaudata TaxID=58733 RepID=UPI0030B8BF11